MTDPRTMTHTHICVFFDSSAWLLIAASLILNTSHVLEHSMHLATCLLLLSCCNQVPYLSSHCLLNIHLPRDIFFFTCETNAWIGTLQSTLGCCYHAGRDFEKLVMIFLKWKSWIYWFTDATVFILALFSSTIKKVILWLDQNHSKSFTSK